MKANKKSPYLNQSQVISGITYDKAFRNYLNQCKSTEDVSCNIFMNFRDGERVWLKVHSISTKVFNNNGKELKVVYEKGIPTVTISSTRTVPLAFLRAYAFVPCPDPTFKKVYRVAHKDKNHTNIDLSNLEWIRQN